jgi:hypothetical protein
MPHHQSIVQQFHGPPTCSTKIFAPENAKQDVARFGFPMQILGLACALQQKNLSHAVAIESELIFSQRSRRILSEREEDEEIHLSSLCPTGPLSNLENYFNVAAAGGDCIKEGTRWLQADANAHETAAIIL